MARQKTIALAGKGVEKAKPKAKPNTKAKAELVEAEDAASVYDVMKLLDITSIASDTKKRYKLAGATTDIEARRSTTVSTGLLMSDVILGGGIFPSGWYTFFGPEQSAKSTHMITAMAAFFFSNVPYIGYYDAEGSTSPDYLEAIARASNVHRDIDIKKVFGIKDPKTGKYVIEPRIHYAPENSLEAIWKSISSILRKLPDKVHVDGEWWLLFENSRDNQSRFKGQNNTKVGGQYGKIAIKALDGGAPQALFIVDSYPAMVSESDDDDDGDNSIGLEARGHSKHVKKVKGRLKRKHATVIGVNQLRDSINIGNPYGPKEYEPGGNALRFYADCRISQRPRSVPHGSGQLEEEPSVMFNGGNDTYRYVLMRAIKNKFGAPYLEAYQRIWASDPKGAGHGFCPVYDTWNYLKSTGQVEGTMGRKFSIQLPDFETPKITWLDFKCLILYQGKDLKDYCAELGIDKPPRIRERCFEQLRAGDGLTKYFNTLHGLEEEDEEDVPYTEWSNADLIEEISSRGLTTKTKAKKMNKEELIELLEVDDGLSEDAEGEEEEETDEE